VAKLSRDLVAGVLHPRETLYASGNLSSLNSEIIVPADGAASVALDLRGTFNATFEVAGTVDGINWTLIPVRPINQASLLYVAAVAGAVAGVWVGACLGYRQVRVRCTAYTSGAAAAVLSTSIAPLDVSLAGTCAPALVTATGAAAAAVTLTLPAPGAGLRQYVSYVSVARFASALLTAGAAPVVVTTTNLPGALAFSFPADAAAQGTIDRLREDFAYPIGASAQNANVTLVCPGTTGVIWRATAGYFVAP
jgi:hypothetical protein